MKDIALQLAGETSGGKLNTVRVFLDCPLIANRPLIVSNRLFSVLSGVGSGEKPGT